MKKSFFKSLIFFFLITFFTPIINYCPAQWVQQNSGTNYPLWDIFFTSAETGWIAADSSYHGKLLKTTNSGENWISQNYGSNKGLWGIYFINQNTGWVVGDYGVIIKTTNAGQNWMVQNIDTTEFFNQVFFLNSATGWITGNSLYKTTDGGNNWIKNPQITTCWAVYFQSENTGFVTLYYSRILRTTNGGSNWDLIYSGDFHTFLKYIYFNNANTGWIAGEGSSSGILKTTNRGLNWTSVFHDSFNSVYFKDVNTGWAAGTQMYKTTNSGVNWVIQNLPQPYYDVTSMTFTNDSTGWAVGQGGKIFKTTNGGVWVTQIGSEVPAKYSLYQNYPNPFNPVTKIKFEVPPDVKSQTQDGYFPLRRGVGGMTSLKVFDILGREVTTLVNEKLNPGTYEVDWNASQYSSGIYFYQLRAGEFSETKKLILLK
ncbi:MAG TPA: YCF48-related protein [Ignavibacteria bacterium]